MFKEGGTSGYASWNCKKDWEEVHQVAFVKKVYSILAVQLSITACMIFAAQASITVKETTYTVNGKQYHGIEPVQTSALYEFFARNLWLTILCCVLSIVIMCAMLCVDAIGRRHPVNLIALFAFTLCESYMITAFTCNPYRFPPKTVMLAGLVTALTTISLTLYAMFSKTPITIMFALLILLIFAMIPVIIIGFIMHTRTMHLIICSLMVMIYGIYLVIDTRIITGKEKHNGIAIDYDDYCIGALILYLDVIMIFMYILSLFGND